MEKFLRVGVIANTHGLRGEVKVYPTTDDINRFRFLTDVIVMARNGEVDLKVENARIIKNMAIVKFSGVDSIDDVLSWKGCDLMVSRENAVPLEEGEYFIADLIGCSVVTDDCREVGRLKDILETGANDVLIVSKADGTELLIPWIDECVLDVDLEESKILVHMIDGLEEL